MSLPPLPAIQPYLPLCAHTPANAGFVSITAVSHGLVSSTVMPVEYSLSLNTKRRRSGLGCRHPPVLARARRIRMTRKPNSRPGRPWSSPSGIGRMPMNVTPSSANPWFRSASTAPRMVDSSPETAWVLEGRHLDTSTRRGPSYVTPEVPSCRR